MTVLRLSRRFDAPPERVFDAWTNPDVLRRWWLPAESWSSVSAEIDLRPGGRYRLALRDGESGAVQAVVGEYLDVRRPERLVYTWTWEDEPELMRGSEGTVVTVEFRDDGDGTEVVLTHERFTDAGIRDLHADGWHACLDNLEREVETP